MAISFLWAKTSGLCAYCWCWEHCKWGNRLLKLICLFKYKSCWNEHTCVFKYTHIQHIQRYILKLAIMFSIGCVNCALSTLPPSLRQVHETVLSKTLITLLAHPGMCQKTEISYLEMRILCMLPCWILFHCTVVVIICMILLGLMLRKEFFFYCNSCNQMICMIQNGSWGKNPI